MATLENIRNSTLITDTAEEKALAIQALTVLRKHYPGYKWGVEFTRATDYSIGSMLINIVDIPTEVKYLINPKDLDRVEMKSVMRGGGLLLEALGLSPRGARDTDDVRSLINTPNGLILPDVDAVPDNNPGYERIKAQRNQFNGM